MGHPTVRDAKYSSKETAQADCGPLTAQILKVPASLYNVCCPQEDARWCPDHFLHRSRPEVNLHSFSSSRCGSWRCQPRYSLAFFDSARKQLHKASTNSNLYQTSQQSPSTVWIVQQRSWSLWTAVCKRLSAKSASSKLAWLGDLLGSWNHSRCAVWCLSLPMARYLTQALQSPAKTRGVLCKFLVCVCLALAVIMTSFHFPSPKDVQLVASWLTKTAQ